MMNRENLTKENFWDDIYTKFPKATQVFYDWIDEYKKNNNWDLIFNSKFKVVETSTSIFSSPKYHELPYALQQGIWIEFCIDVLSDYFEQPEYIPDTDLEEEIKEVLLNIENQIKE